ncbi:MAG: RpiB/LacA/LacB family sugar-phosphate isomerase [Oligoflexales bacterium]|nr:RpiB/LacA/LacB family sugar-phosphate isomerase [Oligoflexales bacterium]
MKLAIASDLSGFSLKNSIIAHLRESHQDIELLDFGIESEQGPKPYFEQAPKVARAIQDKVAERGILICGTGQGMAIVANKHKGIYACVVDSIFSGQRAKIINNANVITLGGWVTAPFIAREIVDGWLEMKFTQKMEFKRDFLTSAFNKVREMEEDLFK